VRIPILGRGDSLELGVAGGVLIYEVLRQRRAPQAGAGARQPAPNSQ